MAEIQATNQTFRLSVGLKDRIHRAAQECEMGPAEWIRAVLESAADLHERQEPEPYDPAPIPDEDTARELAEQAIAERDNMLSEARARRQRAKPGGEKKRLTRDCPHMPSMRMGSRCSPARGGCGISLKAMTFGVASGMRA